MTGHIPVFPVEAAVRLPRLKTVGGNGESKETGLLTGALGRKPKVRVECRQGMLNMSHDFCTRLFTRG